MRLNCRLHWGFWTNVKVSVYQQSTLKHFGSFYEIFQTYIYKLISCERKFIFIVLSTNDMFRWHIYMQFVPNTGISCMYRIRIHAGILLGTTRSTFTHTPIDTTYWKFNLFQLSDFYRSGELIFFHLCQNGWIYTQSCVLWH